MGKHIRKFYIPRRVCSRWQVLGASRILPSWEINCSLTYCGNKLNFLKFKATISCYLIGCCLASCSLTCRDITRCHLTSLDLACHLTPCCITSCSVDCECCPNLCTNICTHLCSKLCSPTFRCSNLWLAYIWSACLTIFTPNLWIACYVAPRITTSLATIRIECSKEIIMKEKEYKHSRNHYLNTNNHKLSLFYF